MTDEMNPVTPEETTPEVPVEPTPTEDTPVAPEEPTTPEAPENPVA